jgi:hypothetical protein
VRAWRHLTWTGAGRLRWAYSVMAFALAYGVLASSYNFYWDTAFLWDRVLVAVGVVAIAVRPAGALLLLAPLLWLRATGDVPLVQANWVAESPLLFAIFSLQALVLGELAIQRRRWAYGVLVGLTLMIFLTSAYRWQPVGAAAALMGTTLSMQWLTRHRALCVAMRPWRALLVLTISMVAGHYLVAAVTKLQLGPSPLAWVFESDLSFLLAFRVVEGWLGGQFGSGTTALLQTLHAHSASLNGVTLLLELAPLAAGFGPRIAQLTLAGVAVLHAAIASMLGILFGGWIVALLALIWVLREPSGRLRYQGWRWGLVVAVTASATLAFSFPRLAWFESPLGHRFLFTVVTEEGAEVVLGRDLLNPYDGASYATPVFLLDFPAFVYGSRNLERVRELRALSASTAPAWVEEHGAIGLDPQQRDTFDRWVRANFLGRSLQAGRAELATSLRPLPKLVPWDSTPLPEGRVGAVHVRFQQVFFDGERPHILTDRIVYDSSSGLEGNSGN